MRLMIVWEKQRMINLWYCEKCGIHMDNPAELVARSDGLPKSMVGMKVCRICYKPVVPSDSLNGSKTK